VLTIGAWSLHPKQFIFVISCSSLFFIYRRIMHIQKNCGFMRMILCNLKKQTIYKSYAIGKSNSNSHNSMNSIHNKDVEKIMKLHNIFFLYIQSTKCFRFLRTQNIKLLYPFYAT